MTRRFLPLLALAALLLAPFGMIGGAAAAMPAHGAETTAGHCDGMGPAAPGDEQQAIDCMIACAALPAVAPAPFVQPGTAAGQPTTLQLLSLAGLAPEAETPPPRRS